MSNFQNYSPWTQNCIGKFYIKKSIFPKFQKFFFLISRFSLNLTSRISNFLTDFQPFQEFPTYSRISNFFKSFQLSQEFPNFSIIFLRISNFFKNFQLFQEFPTFQNFPTFSRISNFLTTFQLFQKFPTFSRIYKNHFS